MRFYVLVLLAAGAGVLPTICAINTGIGVWDIFWWMIAANTMGIIQGSIIWMK